MAPKFLHGAVAVAAIACLPLAPVPATAQDVPVDFTGIVEEMTPAVVAITADRPVDEQPSIEDILPNPFGREQEPDRGPPRGVALGSGFIISQDGHVVTNNHVIQGANTIDVRLSDGSTRSAELVGSDPATDLAVLKMEPSEDLAVAEWGDSDSLQPGAWTIAIGSPFGLGGTVTVGVLSARSRNIQAGPYDNFLQTDASINRGNSGGPLFNAAGRVVGVNTAIFSPIGANIGIGFAVPSNAAQEIVRQLIETGSVERGFIGVSLQPITDAISQALGLESTDGALVADIEPDSPASRAGLQAGDVITALGGESMENPGELSRAVAERSPGEEITLSIIRDGETVEVDLTLATREVEQAAADAEPATEPDGASMGVAVTGLPELLRRELGLEEGQGVMIQRVQPGTPAAEAGLQQGDLILQAGGETVEQVEDLTTAWEEAREQERPVLLRVARDENTLFVPVETEQG
ncbi:Do family serine endopeptidase [Chelativorans sp. M5D2P16]|uniref:Do family serine endopeptidase n=1 Tax=Chelativorans sp. M5D2P16 TaxID=3095678 RepID=UPI002ACAEC05|nr:Do family serine endopeptidase [Chelativorans sp. M5D2P16]MDZ5699610.1 Do family serine endopeptidase [Chelativorans sp. M5D2P16]